MEATKDNEVQKAPAIQAEEEVLKFWDEDHLFEKTLEKNEGAKPYVFYDGPPFATGTPHYGHILASAVKDAVPRYWTMQGEYVRRRWGWDCHGLPIESLVEQKLGISGKKQIEEIGIEKFNETCRANVLKFVDEWGKTVHRIGRFVEFENSYKTMDSTYMESVWWALKQIWEKSLIYEGRKVLLYCPRCETPLSNFEVASDNSYGHVTEDSVYLKSLLEWKGNLQHHTYILYWTTTPWTLPGNLALAVGSEIDYVLLKPSQQDLDAGVEDAQYVVGKSRAAALFNNPEILKEFKGLDLVGASYAAPFDLNKMQSEKSFKIYDADFVTTEDGTGVVHTAVVYGEEDYELGSRVGLPTVQMLDQQGNYNEDAPDFLHGKFYKSAEAEILEHLKKENKVFKIETYTHSVPFCWRCGTRLFYNAVPSWFINIQQIKPRLLELNQEQINWYPPYLKNGRFQKGIESAPDWNISRNRYWATPLPFWKCSNKDCGRSVCIGSLKDLQDKAKNYDEVYKSSDIREVDLHRPNIDQVVIDCPVCNSTMYRVPEVVDCWVESASMPFAELHYPFENKEEFEKNRFPAQFVAEYINQTRAWFYVSHVISTLLFDQAPFQNVVTTGVILAEDGQKMSKSKGNFPDPWLIIDKYGVDALRYYMLSSPVMQGENLSFNEKELEDVYKKIILMLHNILSFYKMYAKGSASDELPKSENVLDQWILALTHQLQFEVTKNMDGYNLNAACRPILKFVNELSTWYVRRSRDRVKAGNVDSENALKTLGYVLIELSKVMAPFMPFISDYLYKNLTGKESVHLTNWNQIGRKKLEEDEENLISKMETARAIVELGLAARKEANIKVRQPLGYLAYSLKTKEESIFIHTEKGLGSSLEAVIAEELNVKEVNHSDELAELPDSILKENSEAKVLLSTKLTTELKEEGYARELERQVQEMRKKFGLNVGELIDIYYNTADAPLESALVEKFDRRKTFASQVKKELEVEADYEAQVEIDGMKMWLGIVKI